MSRLLRLRKSMLRNGRRQKRKELLLLIREKKCMMLGEKMTRSQQQLGEERILKEIVGTG
jgi:hypothetical protein